MAFYALSVSASGFLPVSTGMAIRGGFAPVTAFSLASSLTLLVVAGAVARQIETGSFFKQPLKAASGQDLALGDKVLMVYQGFPEDSSGGREGEEGGRSGPTTTTAPAALPGASRGGHDTVAGAASCGPAVLLYRRRIPSGPLPGAGGSGHSCGGDERNRRRGVSGLLIARVARPGRRIQLQRVISAPSAVAARF